MMYATIFFAFLGLASAAPPKPPPKPKPRPTRCADVLLYDTFGDGWNADVVFQAGANETYQLLDYFDSNGNFPSDQQNCSTRTLQFCNSDETYEFSVDTLNGTVDNSWEVFWAVHYDHKMYYGTIGSSVVIKKSDVEFEGLYDESPRVNECPVCNTTNKVGLPLKLSESRGNGWYGVGHSEVAGFRVPNVLTFSRFVVVDAEDSVVSEGTLCNGNQVICTESFDEGTYFIRFAGLALGDETWEFCGTSGIVGEELQFSIAGGACLPMSKTSNTEQCYSKVAPVGPHDVEVSLETQEELVSVVSTNNEVLLNNMLSYFVSGTVLVCLVVAAVIKFSKNPEFDSLPTESSHSNI